MKKVKPENDWFRIDQAEFDKKFMKDTELEDINKDK